MILRKRFIIILLFNAMVVFSQDVNRIISLAPSLTKTIYLLNAQNKLVGCTSYCELAKTDKKSIVASAISVNIEKVLTLNPDLILATTITNPETIEKIRNLGLNVTVFSTPRSFNEICEQFIETGKLINKESLANSIVKREKKKADSLRQISSAIKKPPKVFFQIGAKPLFTVVPNTFMDDFITFAGGVNIASDLKTGTISRESVLLRNPDVIIIVNMGITGIQEKETWESYHELNAVKKRKILIIDPDHACSPSPVAFTFILGQIVNFLKYN